jgi:hypothetical protein
MSSDQRSETRGRQLIGTRRVLEHGTREISCLVFADFGVARQTACLWEQFEKRLEFLRAHGARVFIERHVEYTVARRALVAAGGRCRAVVAIEGKRRSQGNGRSARARVKMNVRLPHVCSSAGKTWVDWGRRRCVVDGHVVTDRERIPLGRNLVCVARYHVGKHRVGVGYLVRRPARGVGNRDCPRRWGRGSGELEDGLTTGSQFARRVGVEFRGRLQGSEFESSFRESVVRTRISVGAGVDDERVEQVGGRVGISE